MATNTIEKPWADSPLALIPTPVFLTKKHDLFTSGASHMCMVHNSLLRGYNSIYHQALHIENADKPAFIGYCLTWYNFLKAHAENEESSLFLKTQELLGDNTIFEKSHKEHDSFYPGLSEFQKYLINLPSPTDFSGVKLLEIMVSFQEPFGNHMRSEIDTIAALSNHPQAPKEGSVEEKTARDAFDAREGKNLVMSGPVSVMPFFLLNFDSDYEDGIWADWPPIPGPIRWIIISLGRVLHPTWWKFASCNASRKRKVLYATSNPEA